MTTNTLVPGIYRTPQAQPHGIEGLVRTDVAGFVGMTERGPLSQAVRITSWEEYRRTFGGNQGFGYVPYAVRGFFENGGTECWVVRIARQQGLAQELPYTAAATLPGVLRGQTTLAAPAVAGDAPGITISDAVPVQRGDFVIIEANGLKESLPAKQVNGLNLTLAGRLRSPYPAGATVTVSAPALLISAATPGSWGNRIRVQVIPIPDVQAKVNLAVTLESGYDGGPPQREILARVPWNSRMKELVESRSNLIRVDGLTGSLPRGIADCQLSGGADGLDGLTETDYLGDLSEDDHSKWYGLRLLEEQDDVAIVAVPDAVYLKPVLPTLPLVDDPCGRGSATPSQPHTSPAPAVSYTPERIFNGLLDHCRRMRYRVGIVDTPLLFGGSRQAEQWVASAFQSFGILAKYGAAYFPWLNAPNTSSDVLRPPVLVPPSGHVAGLYARTDQQIGVHHPPANGALSFVAGTQFDLTDPMHAELNEAGINGIRQFPGRGILVWGARSLSSESQWRYIHARRLMSYVERSVEIAMQWTVFEPNGYALQRTLVHMLSEFLNGIWRHGGLKGARPEQGFYVKCDVTNNPQSVIDAGQIVCEVGVAIPAPMEFLIFEIRLEAGSVQVQET